MTKMLMRNRYSGNTHMASRMCSSEQFSTTITWNCRGRSMTEALDRYSKVNQDAKDSDVPWPKVRRCAESGRCAIRWKMSPNPSKTPQVTKAPAARNAVSFTTLSSATAAIIPSWRSEGSSARAPYIPPKTPSTRATTKAVSW